MLNKLNLLWDGALSSHALKSPIFDMTISELRISNTPRLQEKHTKQKYLVIWLLKFA